MGFSATYAFVVLFQINILMFSVAKEPVCSKFSYEEQLLEKMIRTEIKVEMIETEIRKTQDTVLNTLNAIKKTEIEITDRFEDLRNNITEEMKRKTQDIEKKEEFFNALFQELRTNFTNDMENERKIIAELQEDIARPSVAFYAHHVTDTILDVTDEIIVFDSTMTNEGSGYDTSSGIFTAPVGGMFQFTVHICTYSGKYSYVGLVVEENVIAKASNYGASYHICSSFGTITRVKSGEQVSVKCLTSSSSAYRLIEDSWRMNTFSGILLNE